LATLTERAVTTVSIDDFGDQKETVTWEKTLEVGLDVAVPAVGGMLLLGFGLLAPTEPRRSRLAQAALVLGCLGLLGAVASLVMAYTG